MNISIPHSWLKDFLITSATPQQIANCLSLCGPSVEKLTKTKDDYLYEIEVTTNRVDCMSVIGIAREAAAILPQFGFSARLKQPTRSNLEVDQTRSQSPLVITDKNHLCHRILAIVLDNVELKPSPKSIQNRLTTAGIRSLNNVIDITNYIMTEVGHPTHVFDYDRIKTKKLILRNSRPGEKIISLDNKQYSLPGEDIVIDDGTGKIIDLPGIIGTANSVVTANTKKIIFFLETNNPVKMRRTSMTLGIRTVAATLNEKGVDPETALIALNQGIQLFKQLTGASIASKVYDLYPHPYQPKVVKTPLQLIKDRLGIGIPTKTIINILDSLGFDCKLKIENSKIFVTVPSWRAKDITIPEDLIEEVARIYGYHRLPSQIMATAIPTNYPDENFHLEHQIKLTLSGLGLNEIYTNPLISANLAQQSGFKLSEHLKIKNALSEDWQYLRRSLIPSHAQNFPAFEIANTYLPRQQAGHPQLPEEKLQLIISNINDFLKLKGIIEALSAKLHTTIIPEYKQNCAVIDLRPVLKQSRIYPYYQPVSSHPPLIEDLTFTLPEKIYLGPVINTIKSTHRLIKSVQLSKIYQQNYTFTITYQGLLKDLSAVDIAPIRKTIVSLLKTKFRAQLVGTLS